MPSFDARFTDRFRKAIRKADHVTVKQACEEIADAPYHARGSHPLSYEWRGFRGADLDKLHRIIFRICEECVSKHQEQLNPLACCGRPEDPKNVVTFVDFGDYHASSGRRRLRPARQYDVGPGASL